MERGLRNNNPGNIRINSENFQGEIKPSQDKSFKQFSTMPYGYRAIFVILGTYLSQGCNTIEKIIGKWAPPNENNTQSYVNNVARMSGVDKNKTLTASDGEAYVKIVIAISFVENGIKANEKDVKAGFALQNKIRK